MNDLNYLNNLQHFFQSGATRSYEFRMGQLKKFRDSLLKYEYEFHQALNTDLKKSPEECWVTETGFLLSEINNAIKHLNEWMQPERVKTNLLNMPSRSKVIKEPLGVVLIIGPWNYPLQLLFTPLVGAIAAGNCAVVKPSEFAPATSAIMKKLVTETFTKDYILLIEGEGTVIIPEMMQNFCFDHVFYTGSTAVGRIIYKLAAEKLVPVTLELGGKSPCIVAEDANINVAARRIAMTKFSNAGQMCVAPDYVLVHESRKAALIAALRKTMVKFFGEDAAQSENYGKIINEKQFTRLVSYLSQGTIVYGGRNDKGKLFIEPTLLENIIKDASIMKEEIFGPILPIIGFSNMEEVKSIIANNPDPLACYLFTSDSKKEQEWLSMIPFGGGCVNNASWHLTNHYLPFGGRGPSGIGQYHGKYSFETFTHKKAIMKTPTWFDPSVKYPPFNGKMKLFKWVIR